MAARPPASQDGPAMSVALRRAMAVRPGCRDPGRRTVRHLSFPSPALPAPETMSVIAPVLAWRARFMPARPEPDEGSEHCRFLADASCAPYPQKRNGLALTGATTDSQECPDWQLRVGRITPWGYSQIPG